MTTNGKMKKRSAATPGKEFDDSEAVTAYMEMLEHPLKSVIEAIRRTIQAADNRITEGIKWNSPSFYCHGWFATFHLRAKNGVQVVLHHGAKARNDTSLSLTLEATSHLLTWPSKDRATVSFTSIEDFQNKQGAFEKIIKQWADYQSILPTP
jgi:hypothetical protein